MCLPVCPGGYATLLASVIVVAEQVVLVGGRERNVPLLVVHLPVKATVSQSKL